MIPVASIFLLFKITYSKKMIHINASDNVDITAPIRKISIFFNMNAKLNKNGIIKILNAPIPKTIPLFPHKKMGSNIIHVNEIELSVIRDHVSDPAVTKSQITQATIYAMNPATEFLLFTLCRLWQMF